MALTCCRSQDGAKEAWGTLVAERDHYKAQLSFSHSDVTYHETELDVLRTSLESKEVELLEARRAREFAEQGEWTWCGM